MLALAEPITPAPVTDQLQERARDQFPVDHGLIDIAGLPQRITRPMLRVGALVTYTVSAEESYQESVECWVDAQSRLPLSDQAVSRLQRPRLAARPDPKRPDPTRAILPAAVAAINEAHRLLDTVADRRRDVLSEHASDAHHQERARASRLLEARRLRSVHLPPRRCRLPGGPSPSAPPRIRSTGKACVT
jgi:hypothetical protein